MNFTFSFKFVTQESPNSKSHEPNLNRKMLGRQTAIVLLWGNLSALHNLNVIKAVLHASKNYFQTTFQFKWLFMKLLLG